MSQTADSPPSTMAACTGPEAAPVATGSRPPSGQWVRFASAVLQLVLLAGIFKLFDIENRALYDRISPLILVGFVVNHLLPQRFRVGFFAFLSVLSVFVVLAWPVGGRLAGGFNFAGLKASLWLVGLGCALIGACHVPLRHSLRCLLVLLLGLSLAAARSEWMPALSSAGIPEVIWPILGSMFMFRILAYLYDLKHREVPFSPDRALAYFFMLPNVLFTLFPLLDYRSFCKSHYNDDPIRIYQVGLRWILRGVLHLLLYRYIYSYCLGDPADVTTALQAGKHILFTFMLYLRVSGTFHLIVGVLHLFGFNLPETHFLYFLSTSFADIWRRMNIYWKDWTQKHVFYPLHSRLGFLKSRRLPVTIGLTFLVTWLLHSYQWYWIRGRFPIELKDFLFWMGFGALVLVNIRWAERKGAGGRLGPPRRTWKSEVLHGLCAAATFFSMSTLWTIWFTPEPEDLKTLGRALASIRAGEAALFAGAALLVGALAVATRGWVREHTDGARSTAGTGGYPYRRHAAEVFLVGGALALAGASPEMFKPLPGVHATIGALKHEALNHQDQARLDRGYYEDLGDVGRFNDHLLEALGGAGVWTRNKAVRRRDDLLDFDLYPSMRIHFKGATLSTNSMGMRDREYSRTKEAGVFRIVLIGASHDMGVGVNDDETYENLCEDRLNRELTGSLIHRYEIINISCGGHGPLQKLIMAETRAPEFQPDLVLYVANSNELKWSANQFDKLVKQPHHELWKEFQPILDAAGVKAGDSRDSVRKKTHSRREDIVRVVLERFARSVRKDGARPVVVFLQVPSNTARTADIDRIYSAVGQSKLPLIDLWGAFDSVPNRQSLWIAPWEEHTNAQGHRLIAGRLFDQLRASGLLPDPGGK